MNKENSDRKYWLFNVHYTGNPEVWKKCKEHGFVAMHYVKGEDNPGNIEPNIKRMRSISEGDIIIAYGGDKSFLGIGEAVGEYYDKPEKSYGITYHQRFNVVWWIADDNPIKFDGTGFMKTMGINELMNKRAIFQIQKSGYEYVLKLMQNKSGNKLGVKANT
jgi:hypothetical protein